MSHDLQNLMNRAISSQLAVTPQIHIHTRLPKATELRHVKRDRDTMRIEIQNRIVRFSITPNSKHSYKK